MLAKMWKKRNILPLLVRLQAGTITMEISLEFPQKIGHSTEDLGIPFLSICPKFALTYKKNICSTMFTAALFIIV